MYLFNNGTKTNPTAHFELPLLSALQHMVSFGAIYNGNLIRKWNNFINCKWLIINKNKKLTLITLSPEPVTNHSLPGSKAMQRTQPKWPLITLYSFQGACHDGLGIVGAFFGTSIFWSPTDTRAVLLLDDGLKRSVFPARCLMSWILAPVWIPSNLEF